MKRLFAVSVASALLGGGLVGCSGGVGSTSAAETASAQSGAIEPRVLSRGRTRCQLSFVESATGAIDPTGRYIALPGFCPRSSRFGDFVVEVIDLDRERSVQLYDFEGDREGYPFFTTEGDLVAISQINQSRSPDDFTQIPTLRYHVWRVDYSGAPRIFDLLTDDARLGGSPRDIEVDPLEPRIALFWAQLDGSGSGGGAIELVSFEGARPQQVALLNKENLGWVAHDPGSFNAVNGLWIGPGLLMSSEWLRVDDRDAGLSGGAGRLGWVIFDVDTGELRSEPERDGPIRLRGDPTLEKIYLGDVERRLPNGILVVSGANTGSASQQHPAGFYELALLRPEDFSLIGSVPAFVADRQLAGYDFSSDGERAYLLKRSGELEIRATRTWELEASIPVSRYIRGGASEVIASPKSDQIVLVGGRRWVVLDLELEL